MLPELGKVSNKTIAALVGVAPFNQQSGKSLDTGHIKGGRKRLRQVLYMVAMTCKQYNPPLAEFYQRLQARKSVLVATKKSMIAVIRKLLTMLNSMMRRQEHWQENYTSVVKKGLTFNIDAIQHFSANAPAWAILTQKGIK